MKKLEGGLRLKGKSKKKPLITIITVVRNGEKTIKRAIESVVNQTYKNIEYIIIDGNSTDKTLNIIKKYNSKIDYWMSEPDKGIYDAMNKGVLLARGEYIQFLNADDYLAKQDVISRISQGIIKYNPDAIYGKIQPFSYDKCSYSTWPNKEKSINDLKKGGMLAFPAVFIKRKKIISLGGFNLEYPIAADKDLIYRFFNAKYKIIFFNKVITYFYTKGVSSKLHINEAAKVVRVNFGLIRYFYYLLVHGSILIVQDIFSRLDLLNRK
jgi:glycosyltransferase involved in cell wall biosynthesis